MLIWYTLLVLRNRIARYIFFMFFVIPALKPTWQTKDAIFPTQTKLRQENVTMSKIASRTPVKLDNRGSGDHRRESGGGRNDRGDKSHGHSRSDSRSKHSDHKQGDANQSHDDKIPEPKSTEEKKFTGRCRLFVGNLTPDVSEDDFKKMFEPYGEVSEVYVNTGRGFGFIRLVSRFYSTE